MLYLIADQLGFPGILNLIRYISFRAGAASATALLIGLLLGPRFISWLRVRQGKGQPIREDGPQSHLAKRGTPTMGGLLILISVAAVGAAVDGPPQPLRLGLPAGRRGFGLIGFLDDYDKVKKAHHAGLNGRTRLALEFLIAGAATALIVHYGSGDLYVPFHQGRCFTSAGPISPCGAFVIVAFGNAVNLTDGLDGLATMPVIIASIAFLLISYLVGNAKFAAYLGIPHFLGVGDLTVLLLAIVGAGLAFLWFNAPPAAVFMGDTGSLALGGALGAVSVATHHEFVLAIVGGIFVVEALSVVIQVAVYKRTGKRVFLMAPIHHHFEQLGWSEPTVVIRFWIISFVLALAGPQHPQAAVITASAFAGKHYAVYGLARSGLATVEALLASGAKVTAWDARKRRGKLLPSIEGGGPRSAGGGCYVRTPPSSLCAAASPIGRSSHDRRPRHRRPHPIRQPGRHPRPPPQPPPDRAARPRCRRRNHRRHRAVRPRPARAAAAQGRRHHRHQRQVDHHRARPPHPRDRRRADDDGRQHRPARSSPRTRCPKAASMSSNCRAIRST